MTLAIKKVDFDNSEDLAGFTMLLKHYTSDPAGGGQRITEDRIHDTIRGLAERPYAHSFLTHLDARAVGLVTCFESFSTFLAKPILNIHDFVVLKSYRNQGIAQKMLTGIEMFARNKGFAKITLEVLEHNEPATKAYSKFGFKPYRLNPEHGTAQFWQKEVFDT